MMFVRSTLFPFAIVAHIAILSSATFVAAQDHDPWLGKSVFIKPTAVAKVENAIVDRKFISFPSTVEAVNGNWLWLGRGWVQKSDCMLLQEAFDYYFEEVGRSPSSSTAWYCRATCWAEKGEFNNAIKDYNEAIRINPKGATAYIGRGLTKVDVGDFTGAIRDLDEAIKLDSTHAMAYYNRGYARMSLNENAAAIRDFEDAIRHDPKDSAFYFARAIAKGDLADYSGSVRDYDEAIRLNPKFATAYRNRGWTNHLQKNYVAAISDYDEASKLNPRAVSPRIYKAILLATAEEASVRQPETALHLAESVLADEPKNAFAMNAKSCALAAKEDFEQAMRWQEKAARDERWSKEEGIDGGTHADARIEAWKSRRLWHP